MASVFCAAGEFPLYKLLVVCAFLSLLLLPIAGCADQAPTATPVPTSTPAPTETPTAVPTTTLAPTVEPTATPRPTPEPTWTPRPPTPTPTCPTEEELAYVVLLIVEFEEQKSNSSELSDLFSQLSNDGFLIVDADWIFSIKAQLAALDRLADAMIELSAPSSMSSVEKEVGEMAQLLKAAVDDYATAIDNIDPDLLLAGSEQLGHVPGAIERITQAIETLCEG